MVAAGAGAAGLNPSPQRRRSASALSPSKSTNSNSNADAFAAPKPKPKAKPVSSRYLLTPSSKSTSASASTASSASSTSSSTPSRRFASPLSRRSASTERPRPAANAAAAEAGVANGATTTTTRSLSVAFQGPSYALATSKAKPASPSPARRPAAPAAAMATTPERRRPNVGTVRGKGFEAGHNQQLWPTSAKAGRVFEGSALAKSMDCSLDKNSAAVLAAVRSLRQSMGFDEGVRRASFDGVEYLTLSSDTESVSSGSNSGSQDAGTGTGIACRARPSLNGMMSVPGRFLRDAVGSRSDRFADLSKPFSTRSSGVASPSPKTAPVKKSLLNGLLSSPLNRAIRQPSPTKPVASLSKRTASPSRVRRSACPTTTTGEPQGKVSSGCSLDGDTRRGFVVTKVEEEHLLRILYNRHLQWRCANAQANATLAAQTLAAEKYLCGAWIATLGMRKSAVLKRFQLQLFRNNWKLGTVMKGQMAYLEEWSLLERNYANSLSGIAEALTATILCLPVTDGAKADIQDVKNAVGSSVDIMQTMGSSIRTILPKLARTSILVSELAKIATQERILMEQSRELLSALASMHVKYCSLQGQRVQLQLTKKEALCAPNTDDSF